MRKRPSTEPGSDCADQLSGGFVYMRERAEGMHMSSWDLLSKRKASQINIKEIKENQFLSVVCMRATQN